MSSSTPPRSNEAAQPARTSGDLAQRPRWVLELIEGQDVQALSQTLATSPADYAVEAAWALGSLGLPEGLPALLEATTHEAPVVRRAAAESLGLIGTLEAGKALLPLLADPDPDVRGTAAWAAGGLGVSEAVEGLVALLGERAFFTDGLGEKEVIGWQAAHSLSLFGSTAVPALLAALESRDPTVRANASMSLGFIEDPRAVEALARCLKDDDREVLKAALNALSDQGTEVPLEDLDPLLSHAAEEVRWSAVLLLGHQPGPGATRRLLEALDDSLDEIALLAAGSLGTRADDAAVEGLLQVLEGEPARSAAAARALGQIGDRKAEEPLLSLLEQGEDEQRAAAAEALARLGCTSAVEPLKRLLADSSRSVRTEALTALHSLTGISFGGG